MNQRLSFMIPKLICTILIILRCINFISLSFSQENKKSSQERFNIPEISILLFTLNNDDIIF